MGLAGEDGRVGCGSLEDSAFSAGGAAGPGGVRGRFRRILGHWRGHPCGEPELVVRSGIAHAARLIPARSVSALPAGQWRITVGGGGTLEDLVVRHASPRGAGVPARCGWRWAAVGVNFRDVLVALGMYCPGGGELGVEGAGVIVEVGPGGQGLWVGDPGDGLVRGRRI